ncbi:uncharacterized protein LOC124368585 [Homalodisca vitripennis]|uniref:uncharacterized protein LOC124368585 n=1 Tax=Homalodisca vitripennis TaxID=197043 RepID=UPI001EECEA67|nr:uncharacterized protein LOC124368585 [Homalodisca vitripennis]XP_046681784.1 uncharacterized protein LOC124368585 [Homalodisca vitripennis]
MWTIVVVATAILTSATAFENGVPYQYPYSYPQNHMSSATYTGWRAPTWGYPKSFQHSLLDTFSSLCPDCLKADGVDEVTGIPGLKDAIEYSYFHTIKPTMNEMLDNLRIDKGVAYRYFVSLCERNEHVINILPGGDVLKMFCSDIKQTLEEGYL